MTQANAVIEHEGVKYRKVEREAKVGELVVVLKGSGWYSESVGAVFKVIDGRDFGFSKYSSDGGDVYIERQSNEDGSICFMKRINYAVLEPLEPAPTKSMPKLTDAKPGDTVRIVAVDDLDGEGYKNGEEFKVDSVWGNRHGVEVVDERRAGGFGLYAEEFEVVRECKRGQPINGYKPSWLSKSADEQSEIFADELAVSLEQAAQLAADQPYDAQGERIAAACNDLSVLLIRKNHDYGDSFAKQYDKYGMISALIRMDDKMRRLEKLVDGSNAQVDESIEDTLIDLAGYALLAAVELRKTKP